MFKDNDEYFNGVQESFVVGNYGENAPALNDDNNRTPNAVIIDYAYNNFNVRGIYQNQIDLAEQVIDEHYKTGKKFVNVAAQPQQGKTGVGIASVSKFLQEKAQAGISPDKFKIIILTQMGCNALRNQTKESYDKFFIEPIKINDKVIYDGADITTQYITHHHISNYKQLIQKINDIEKEIKESSTEEYFLIMDESHLANQPNESLDKLFQKLISAGKKIFTLGLSATNKLFDAIGGKSIYLKEYPFYFGIEKMMDAGLIFDCTQDHFILPFTISGPITFTQEFLNHEIKKLSDKAHGLINKSGVMLIRISRKLTKDNIKKYQDAVIKAFDNANFGQSSNIEYKAMLFADTSTGNREALPIGNLSKTINSQCCDNVVKVIFVKNSLRAGQTIDTTFLIGAIDSVSKENGSVTIQSFLGRSCGKRIKWEERDFIIFTNKKNAQSYIDELNGVKGVVITDGHTVKKKRKANTMHFFRSTGNTANGLRESTRNLLGDHKDSFTKKSYPNAVCDLIEFRINYESEMERRYGYTYKVRGKDAHHFRGSSLIENTANGENYAKKTILNQSLYGHSNERGSIKGVFYEDVNLQTFEYTSMYGIKKILTDDHPLRDNKSDFYHWYDRLKKDERKILGTWGCSTEELSYYEDIDIKKGSENPDIFDLKNN